jgi:Flp pilus assembly protein TadD
VQPTGPDLERLILEELGRGRAEAGEALIREAIRVSPDNARLRAFQGLVAEAAGDQRAAVRCYRAALYLDPRLFQVRYLLGRSLERTGWREQAHRAYRDVLATTGMGLPTVEIPGLGLLGIPSTAEVSAACQRALEESSSDRRD